MQGNCSHFPLTVRKLGLAMIGSVLLASLATTGFAPPAQALPSFARQTGQPCGTCHTDFPSLTPFGRRFKLRGYTIGGGKFRTTPFASGDDSRAAADKLRDYARAVNAGSDGADKPWVPPVAMMAIAGFTHTQAPLPPPSAPYGTNDTGCFLRSVHRRALHERRPRRPASGSANRSKTQVCPWS